MSASDVYATDTARTPSRRRRLMVLLFAAGTYFGIAGALAWSTIRPKRLVHDVDPTVYGLAYERIRFRSADGTELSGWLVPAGGYTARSTWREPRGIVILCHGVDSTRNAMLPAARMLHSQGFATLLFDFRARGESEGSRCTIGFREVDDLLAAIQFIRGRGDTRKLPIGVLGESMGGAVAIMGAARSPEVAAVIAESPFAVLTHAIDNHFRAVLGPAGPLLGAPARWIGERLIGCACEEVAPVKEIGKIAPRPLLLIEDSEDRLCPPRETESLLEKAREPKQIWKVPGAGHIAARMVQPAEYERRISRFFKEAIPSAADHLSQDALDPNFD